MPCRVVAFPEGLEQPLVRDLARIVDHEHHLVVAGAAAAHLLVGRIWRAARRIADRGDMDAVPKLPELSLGAPEAAQTEHRGLEAIRIRTLERTPIDEVVARGRDRLRAARQRLCGGGHFQFFLEHEHRAVSFVRMPQI